MVNFNGKKGDLLKWCIQTRVFSSAQVHEWGVNNHYICADRRVREFAHEIIRRIPDYEARSRGLVKEGNANIAWYEIPQVELKTVNNQLVFI